MTKIWILKNKFWFDICMPKHISQHILSLFKVARLVPNFGEFPY